MGRFKNWLESTARKRAIQNSAKGLLPNRPGSDANNPRTDVVAHLSIGKKGEVGEHPVFDKDDDDDNSGDNDKPKKKEKDYKESKVPDRSFDAFARAADKFKEEIPEIMKRAKEKERDLDAKEKEAADTTEKEEDSDSSHGEESKEGYQKKWKDFQAAKDREAEGKTKKDTKNSKNSEDESLDSDNAT
jgi:hypothetical protein